MAFNFLLEIKPKNWIKIDHYRICQFASTIITLSFGEQETSNRPRSAPRDSTAPSGRTHPPPQMAPLVIFVPRVVTASRAVSLELIAPLEHSAIELVWWMRRSVGSAPRGDIAGSLASRTSLGLAGQVRISTLIGHIITSRNFDKVSKLTVLSREWSSY